MVMKPKRLRKLLDSFPNRKAAAEVAGKSVSQLSRYLREGKAPFEPIAKMAIHQGFSLDWLVGNEIDIHHRSEDMSLEEIGKELRKSTHIVNELRAEYGEVSSIWSTTIQQLIVLYQLPEEGARQIFKTIQAEAKEKQAD